MRTSYYKRFVPQNPNELNLFYEKDGKEFLDAALMNENIFSDLSLRSTLREICWRSSKTDFLYINLFRSAQERFEKENPEWFVESLSGHNQGPLKAVPANEDTNPDGAAIAPDKSSTRSYKYIVCMLLAIAIGYWLMSN